MSRMNTQERTIFLNNLDRMLSLLNCTYKNINIKYAYFPIPRTTIYRWMTGNTYPNKDWSWGEEFLSFYNQIFDPEIEDSKEFFQKKLSYMQLKEKFVFDDFTKQYLGNYFIYYFFLCLCFFTIHNSNIVFCCSVWKNCFFYNNFFHFFFYR